MKYISQICCVSFFALLTACAPAASSPAASSSAAPEVLSLQQFMENKGAIVIDLEKLSTGHEMLLVEINGIEGNFVLDSGAGVTVLHDEFVEKYGLNSEKAIAADQASGAGGRVDVNRYDISSLKLEGHVFELNRVNAINLKSVVQGLKNAAGVDIDGVIGQDILTPYGGVIDVANSQLYLSAIKIASEDDAPDTE